MYSYLWRGQVTCDVASLPSIVQWHGGSLLLVGVQGEIFKLVSFSVSTPNFFRRPFLSSPFSATQEFDSLLLKMAFHKGEYSHFPVIVLLYLKMHQLECVICCLSVFLTSQKIIMVKQKLAGKGKIR